MSDNAAASHEPTDPSDATPRARASSVELARRALREAPVLAGLCALAALVAMALNQLALPALGARGVPLLVSRLARAGQFAENLAVFAGVISLVASAVPVARRQVGLSRTRRVFGVVLMALLLRAVVIATLLERQSTTKENVYLAIGAANALSVLCGMAAIDVARSWLGRTLAVLATSAPLTSLLATTLALTMDVEFDPWKRRSYETLEALRELSYLGVLLVGAFAFAPRPGSLRSLLARGAGFAVFGSMLALFHAARTTLPADFSLLVYHAQRVDLFIDSAPFVYALPFGAALATAAAATLRGGPYFQAGAGLLLVFASGSAPQAPGRLLTMTLGFVLLARAQSLFEERA